MTKKLSFLSCLALISAVAVTIPGCGASGDNGVVAPPSDEAARAAQEAAEADYDKELMESNQ